jgi:hypothetical protein
MSLYICKFSIIFCIHMCGLLFLFFDMHGIHVSCVKKMFQALDDFLVLVTHVHFDLSGHIHKYNSLDAQPDILRSLYSALQPSSTSEDRRYNSKGVIPNIMPYFLNLTNF